MPNIQTFEDLLENKIECTSFFLFCVKEYSLENLMAALLYRRWIKTRRLPQAEYVFDICFSKAVFDINLPSAIQQATVAEMQQVRLAFQQQRQRILVGAMTHTRGQLHDRRQQMNENWVCPGHLFAKAYTELCTNLADTYARYAPERARYQHRGFSIARRPTFDGDYAAEARQIMGAESMRETVRVIRHVFETSGRVGMDIKADVNYRQIEPLLAA